jgi:hypothetical protein
VLEEGLGSFQVPVPLSLRGGGGGSVYYILGSDIN